MASHVLRRTLGLVVAVALAATACTSGSDETTTAAGAGSTTSVGDTATTTRALEDVDAAMQQMCRTLDLLSAAGVPGPQAAAAMWATDLAEATSAERAAYGNILAQAPAKACLQHVAYADDVAYWLGL